MQGHVILGPQGHLSGGKFGGIMKSMHSRQEIAEDTSFTF